jgi:hypothetical protein
MDNIIVASTNLFGLKAIQRSLTDKKYLEAFLLTGSMTSSITYHLAEHSKHHMTGIKFLIPYEKILLNFDRFFATATVLLFLNKYYITNKYKHNLNKLIAMSLFCLVSSEGLHFSLKNILPVWFHKILFIGLHGSWHVLVFNIAYIMLKTQPKYTDLF